MFSNVLKITILASLLVSDTGLIAQVKLINKFGHLNSILRLFKLSHLLILPEL